MRERQDREQRGQEERVIDALQKECAHFRNLCEDLERQNRHLQGRINEQDS